MYNDKIIKWEKAYIAECAVLTGKVSLGENTGIWYHAVLRGDADEIRIGKCSNVQDNAVIHVDPGYPVNLGDYVTIGHGAILHGCKIGDESLIGMGAIILNGARIGKNCLIGAGALVTQNMEIPDGSLVYGNPARIVRKLTEAEKMENRKNADDYVLEIKKLLEK